MAGNLHYSKELNAIADKIMERGLLFDAIKSGQICTLNLEYIETSQKIELNICIDERSKKLSKKEESNIINIVNEYLNLKNFGNKIYEDNFPKLMAYSINVTFDN